MIFRLLLSVLAPALVGFLLVSILWPERKALRAQLLLKLCLGAGVGLGVFSCLYFLQLSITGPSKRNLWSILLGAVIALLAAGFFLMRKDSPGTEVAVEQAPDSKLRLSLSIIVWLALLSTLVAFIFLSLKRPHGEWDAWAVYNMKARFLFRAGADWRDLFSPPLVWSGPDYPLLIPTIVAACWTLIGRDTLIVPAVIALVFTLATAGVATSTVSMLRGKTQGLLVALIMLSTPYFISHGADQYSDIPIGFFFLATLAMFHLQDGLDNRNYRFLIIAGVAAGLAAWTKNEGLLFILAVVAARFVTIVRRDGLKPSLRQTLFFAAGLIPVMAVVIFFKVTIAAHNGLIAPPEGLDLGSKLFSISRYRTILDLLLRTTMAFGNWTVSVVPLLIFYTLLLGIKVEEKQRASVLGTFIVLGIMLAGYFVIYLITPRDVVWHITTSLDRLLSQLWPSFVVGIFLIVRTPEEALMKEDALPASA